MGDWKIDTSSLEGVLWFSLKGTFNREEMLEFVEAHHHAVDSFAGRTYQVWADLRELNPLGPEAADAMEKAKRYSAAQRNFAGSAVHVSSATISLQHQRTSVSSGVMKTELISNDEDALWEHLRSLRRSP